jgi:hypothetical protein
MFFVLLSHNNCEPMTLQERGIDFFNMPLSYFFTLKTNGVKILLALPTKARILCLDSL